MTSPTKPEVHKYKVARKGPSCGDRQRAQKNSVKFRHVHADRHRQTDRRLVKRSIRLVTKIRKIFDNTTSLTYQLSHVWDSLLTNIRNQKSVPMKTSDWLCYRIFYVQTDRQTDGRLHADYSTLLPSGCFTGLRFYFSSHCSTHSRSFQGCSFQPNSISC